MYRWRKNSVISSLIGIVLSNIISCVYVRVCACALFPDNFIKTLHFTTVWKTRHWLQV